MYKQFSLVMLRIQQNYDWYMNELQFFCKASFELTDTVNRNWPKTTIKIDTSDSEMWWTHIDFSQYVLTFVGSILEAYHLS